MTLDEAEGGMEGEIEDIGLSLLCVVFNERNTLSLLPLLTFPSMLLLAFVFIFLPIGGSVSFGDLLLRLMDSGGLNKEAIANLSP